jgi:hypothetical protein
MELVVDYNDLELEGYGSRASGRKVQPYVAFAAWKSGLHTE